MSQPDSKQEGLSVASHGVLFEPAAPDACDACGGALRPALDDDGTSPASPGRGRDLGDGKAGTGAYVWVRGDRVEVEVVPLCESCASAIGMSALARWEIEEEEG